MMITMAAVHVVLKTRVPSARFQHPLIEVANSGQIHYQTFCTYTNIKKGGTDIGLLYAEYQVLYSRDSAPLKTPSHSALHRQSTNTRRHRSLKRGILPDTAKGALFAPLANCFPGYKQSRSIFRPHPKSLKHHPSLS
jgi:hypothetical protein